VIDYTSYVKGVGRRRIRQDVGKLLGI
jgi:hypothetical protein